MRRFAAAAALCFALAILHTWPIATAPHRHSLNANADAELNAWIVSWIAYALPNEPRHLFAGNIFQPDDHALAYSEPLVVPALAGAPIRWLGGSAVLTFNLLLIGGLAATALAAWTIGARWTGSFWAGMVAASLTAFNTHLLTRLPHLQGAHAWGLPLALLLTDLLLTPRTSTRQSLPAILALGVVIAATAATSEYWFVFVAVVIAVQAAVGARSRAALGHIVLAWIIGCLLALPVLWPYLRLASEGIRRPLEQAAALSATPSAYLTTLSRVDAMWSARFFTRDINVLSPGVLGVLFAVLGCAAAFHHAQPSRRRALTMLALAATGIILSLGPATPIYSIAYAIVLPLQGLRVPARFGYLALLAVAMLSAYGVAALQRRTGSRSLSFAAGALAFAAVTVEAWHGPVQTTRFDGVPRIYSVLDRAPAGSLLVEAPFWPAEAVFGNAEYVLNATEHRMPTMNGYSGFTPDSYRRRAQWFWFFPEPWAIAAMRKEGATHVMVHLEQFGAEAESVKRVLDQQTELILIAEDAIGHRLYQFRH